MKNFKVTALLAIAALGMPSNPAMAASFNPPYASTVATGYVKVSAFGLQYDCQITYLDLTTGVGGSNLEALPGVVLTNTYAGIYQPCGNIAEMFENFYIYPKSTTQIEINELEIPVPFRLCRGRNIKMSWKNYGSYSVMSAHNINVGSCIIEELNMNINSIQII